MISVWSTKAASRNVYVTAEVAAGSGVGAPGFSVCPHSSGASCSVGNLKVGQAVSVEVAVPVQASAVAGQLVELTAVASAAGALGYACTATDLVSLTPAAGSSSPGSLLPAVPGTSVSPVDPSGLFPTVLPSGTTTSPPTDGTTSILPADTTASAVPDNARLDAQLAGIAALGAITIGIGTLLVRMSMGSFALRAKRAREKKSEEPTPTP